MSSNTTGSNSNSHSRFRVTLNHIDYTIATPGALDNSTLPKVPILRVYGNSSAGSKACVHIHQVYPYFYVEYLASLHPKEVKRYIRRLTKSLNHAVALSLKRNPESANSQYIRAAILVKGIHFYGFHSSYSPFLKVLVADPSMVNRVVTILRSGIIMKTRFRIYESHLSFPLQFMCDFGLYGCGTLELDGGWERCMDDTAETQSSLFKRSPHFRQSRLPLELDVIAPQVLNRHNLNPRNMAFNIGEPPPVLQDERFVLSVRELWEDESSRRQARGLNPTPEIPVDPSASSRAPGGDWVAEARYWEAIRKRIASEPKMQLSSTPEHWEHRVMTTFESIEAIWAEEFQTWKPSLPPSGSEAVQETVDERELAHNDKEEPLGGVEVDLELLSAEDLDAQDVRDLQEARHEDVEETRGLTEEAEEVLDDEVPLDEEEEEEPEEIVKEQSPEDPFAPTDASDSKEPPLPETPMEFRLASPPIPSRLLIPSGSREVTPTPARPDPISSFLPSDRESDAEDAGCSQGAGFKRKASSTGSQAARKKRKVLFTDHDEEGGDLPLTFPTSDAPKSQPSKAPLRNVKLSRAFLTCKTFKQNLYQYSVLPPTREELMHTLAQHDVAQKVYRKPYYSNADDAPLNSREYGGLVFHLKGPTLDALEEWVPGKPTGDDWRFSGFEPEGVGGWEYASSPPSPRETRKWLANEARTGEAHMPKKWRSQIEGPTQANIYGFKNSPAVAGPGIRGSAGLSILCLEVFAPVTGDVSPNAESDEIVAAFYALQTAGDTVIQAGVMAVRAPELEYGRLREFEIEFSGSELDLINNIVDTVADLDPDIITGWEVQGSSWGYLAARGKELGLDVSELIARAPPRDRARSNEQWGFRQTSTFQTIGRHVFNAWRIMRSEQTLTIYTFENVVFNVLQRRFPKYSIQTLSGWYRSPKPAHTTRLLHHMLRKTCMVLEILEETEVVTKSAEFARIFGVDFFSVISRGSQFKVESFMFRIAKPESFVLISPSKADVGKQNAAECMPLIMEPTSALYTSPLVVLDFQSLYPSVMIAYNYCYSTCLGRVHDFQGTWKFGVDTLNLPEGLLGHLASRADQKEPAGSLQEGPQENGAGDNINEGDVIVAPNGMMYVKSKVRKGLLGRMLTELLDTRVMVKQAMKGVKNDKALKRVLDARQLALKFIANVTYGYTSASFSGRMPAVEIADSIVQTGRETLEKAILLVNNTKKWGAQVMYGDTDSMFIYLRGRTKEEAFRIGYEIADTVTAMNPTPIKLKFEKVYLPCVLMAKKRYVGFKYETIDATEPGFDAKGIETVRRDGVMAQRKMTENCLKILFRTQDLSQVKEYCCQSWTKLLDNRASVHDFIFAKEVRMGTYSEHGPPPPGVIVAARKMIQDPNYEAQYAERVPYVIAKGEPGSRLVDRAMDPYEFFQDKSNQLDAEYYITRVLMPPLERIFNLVGADVKQWYNEIRKPTSAENSSPKKFRANLSPEKEKRMVEELFGNMKCLICGEPSFGNLCYRCYANKDESVANLGSIIYSTEKRLKDAQSICASCTGMAQNEPNECVSMDCPWFYDRQKTADELGLVPLYNMIIKDLEKEIEEGVGEAEVELQWEVGTIEDDSDVGLDWEEAESAEDEDGFWAGDEFEQNDKQGDTQGDDAVGQEDAEDALSYTD
ncbi:hypothetical protein BKA70DRAFT_332306 [Coprinopsis sp. MPI-PUGE-AT-0042]|nr:hypothetical protein BKA70DRAFT_332306 [Coprinopsis sp. MPI-PUGE-AT-0042]